MFKLFNFSARQGSGRSASSQCYYLGARCIDVSEVLDRWLDPAHRYFKLRGNDNAIYILRHSTTEDSWEMTLFDSGTQADTRLSST